MNSALKYTGYGVCKKDYDGMRFICLLAIMTVWLPLQHYQLHCCKRVLYHNTTETNNKIKIVFYYRWYVQGLFSSSGSLECTPKFSISVSADIAREMGRYYWLCHFPISAPLASLANIKIDFYDDME